MRDKSSSQAPALLGNTLCHRQRVMLHLRHNKNRMWLKESQTIWASEAQMCLRREGNDSASERWDTLRPARTPPFLPQQTRTPLRRSISKYTSERRMSYTRPWFNGPGGCAKSWLVHVTCMWLKILGGKRRAKDHIQKGHMIMLWISSTWEAAVSTLGGGGSGGGKYVVVITWKLLYLT